MDYPSCGACPPTFRFTLKELFYEKAFTRSGRDIGGHRLGLGTGQRHASQDQI